MAAVLLMVGRGQEDPSIVSRLLDVDATPSKPYYNMAAEVRDLPCMPASPAPARSILARYCGPLVGVERPALAEADGFDRLLGCL